MHELLLFGFVPQSRHDQVLTILCGVAGTRPQSIIERHLIFMPKKTPESRQQVGGTQELRNQQAQALQGQLHGELFHLQLVGEVEEGQFPGEHGGEADATHGQESFYDFEQQSWTLRFNDFPEVAGRRPVTSRLISAVDIIDGDAIEFMDAFGYKFVSEYILEGHRVVHNNLVLLLHRILRFPPDNTDGVVAPAPKKHLPPYGSLIPLDASDRYILQASARVQDGSKPESMTIGITELKQFKDLMKGVVDLEIGDRLALDPRVK